MGGQIMHGRMDSDQAWTNTSRWNDWTDPTMATEILREKVGESRRSTATVPKDRWLFTSELKER